MKTVIITGGTGLIGSALATFLLKNGNKVILTSRNPNKEKFIENNDLNGYKENLFILELDYYSSNSIQNFVKNIENENIFPEVIIHNARSVDTLKIESNGQTSSENFINEYQMGIVGPYILNNLLIESTSGNRLNNIIFISSIYGVVAPSPSLYDDFEHQSPIQYGVTKAAQIHLTKELAVRYSPKGIRVNAISLGGIKGRVKESFIKKYSKLNPQNRMFSVIDVIKPLEFLIKNDSESITGHNLIVDGGWTIW